MYKVYFLIASLLAIVVNCKNVENVEAKYMSNLVSLENINDDLESILSDFIEFYMDKSKNKNSGNDIVVICFSENNKVPQISLRSSYYYDTKMTKGFMLYRSFLIVFYTSKPIILEKFIEGENKVSEVPSRYLNEKSEDFVILPYDPPGRTYLYKNGTMNLIEKRYISDCEKVYYSPKERK